MGAPVDQGRQGKEGRGKFGKMLAGLVCDSHDNLPMIARAVEVCRRRKAEVLFHAGDFIAPFAAKAWVTFAGPIFAVFGNNDGERAGLRQVLPDLKKGPRLFRVGWRKVLVSHREEDLREEMVARADLLVVGHTHRRKVEARGAAVLVNPGEVGAWLTGQASLALVELDTLAVELVDL
jgi:putative phosphoesterase